MSLPKNLWYIKKNESVIPPFNTRGKLNLEIGCVYKIYAKNGRYDFLNQHDSRVDINNQTIVLFLGAERAKSIGNIPISRENLYELSFLYDSKIIKYHSNNDNETYNCEFIKVTEEEQ